MSIVRRCDNPDCKLGPNGTANVAATANPDGWLTGSVALTVGGDGDQADYCSSDCATVDLTAQAKAATADPRAVAAQAEISK